MENEPQAESATHQRQSMRKVSISLGLSGTFRCAGLALFDAFRRNSSAGCMAVEYRSSGACADEIMRRVNEPGRLF
jgi:hypothetical protein